jgi:microcystin-dependent protein
MPLHTHQYWDTRNWTASVNTAATGGSQAHENMPPFYVLAWIYKL